ncbi:MAG: glycosyltransferase [Bacteroidetes bacterium]|nr:glycosyltransferase [Bacteroidota bacterium]
MIHQVLISVRVFGLELGLVPLILTAMAISFAVWQIVFHYVHFLKLIQFKQDLKINTDHPVSVIICAKNEKDNLSNYLPSILEQDYPSFEVIVVNDGSWDGTEEILAYFSERYSNLKVVELKEEIKRIDGKKFPLTLGIKAAKNEILLLTDADCVTTSNQWIKLMVAPYANPEIEMVLGYSPYHYKQGLLNLLIRAETSLTAMMYFSFAISGKPYMGVGRNLSYKRELFFRHKGFASHHHIPSGDDDLFVRDAATSSNTAVVFDPKSRMLSVPKITFSDWFKQKRRHLFVGKYYHSDIKRKLASFSYSHFLFWASVIALFFFSPTFLLPICIIVIRWLIQFPVVYYSFKRLGHNLLALFMPLLDIAYLFYSIFSGMVYLFSKKPKW